MTEKKCQKKCKLDQDTLVCLGCNRTLKEIVDAGNAAKEQREATRASQRKDGKKSKAA